MSDFNENVPDVTSSGPGELIKKCSRAEIPALNVAAGLRMGCSQVCFMGWGVWTSDRTLPIQHKESDLICLAESQNH